MFGAFGNHPSFVPSRPPPFWTEAPSLDHCETQQGPGEETKRPMKFSCIAASLLFKRFGRPKMFLFLGCCCWLFCWELEPFLGGDGFFCVQKKSSCTRRRPWNIETSDAATNVSLLESNHICLSNKKQYLYIPGKCSVDRFQKQFLRNQPSIFRNSLPKGSLSFSLTKKGWFINSTNLPFLPPFAVSEKQKIPHSKPKTQQSNWVIWTFKSNHQQILTCAHAHPLPPNEFGTASKGGEGPRRHGFTPRHIAAPA